MVVEVKEVSQSQPGFPDSLYFLQIDVFIFDSPPEPLHKNIVQRSAAPVHADFDALVQQRASETQGGKLCALVGVEYLTVALL